MKSEERYALKLNIAKLYYIEKYTQEQIRKRLNVSRPTMIKLMREAQDEGIVKIEVCDVRKLSEISAMESELKRVLGLKDVKIVDVPGDSMREINAGIGKAAAPYIQESVKSNMRIGVGWGKTLEEAADGMRTIKKARNANFMPILGGPGSVETDAKMYSNALCENIASRFEGSVMDYVYAPLFVEDPVVRDAYMKLPNIVSVMEKFNELDLAMVGVDGDAGHSTTFNAEHQMMGFVPADGRSKIAGNVCAHFYDRNGNVLFEELESRVIAIGVEQLRRIPVVVGLAGGAHKVDSIIGGAKAGLFNVLITDVFTARKVLED